MTQEQSQQLKKQGYTIIRSMLPDTWYKDISSAMDRSFANHRSIQIENKNDIATDGVALHAVLNDPIFLGVIYYLIETGFIKSLEEEFFKSKAILNSFSALNNLPNQPNFSANIHRDLRFYSGEFPMMLNCLIMVDDFTIENGGTYLLPGSHLEERRPSDDEFFSKAIQAVGKRGDILVFNANVWHCSAPNKTQSDRKALPFTISKSFMKQLLDYPRAFGYEKMHTFTEEMQQFLGYYSRVPASLDEWYQPEDKRLYKKNQD